jgi:hypothetical protein
MSTRSTTHFTYGAGRPATAIIYRHADGYPEGQGKDLLEFFHEVAETVQDTRFNDPSYLAAKLVVWLARKFAVRYERVGESGRNYDQVPTGYLDFISVGVVQQDPSDIEYRYIVDCSTMIDGRPGVLVEEGYGSDWKPLGEVATVLKAAV